MWDLSGSTAPVILVVEDEPLIGDLVGDYLEDLGFSILRAANAVEALGILASQSNISLVFSDVVMPGSMDGFGLARWIGAHHPKIPVLLTSGYWGERPPPELAAAPLLPKPYSLDRLRNCLIGLIGVPPQLTE